MFAFNAPLVLSLTILAGRPRRRHSRSTPMKRGSRRRLGTVTFDNSCDPPCAPT